MANAVKVSFCGLLTILFNAPAIGLKLCGVIDWSWWWVLAPLWGVLLVAFFGVARAVFTK